MALEDVVIAVEQLTRATATASVVVSMLLGVATVLLGCVLVLMLKTDWEK